MKYFKNTELAKLYHISEKSVRNWIESAEAGKLDLQLFDKNGKNYIANTSKNTLLIEKQVERGKKFKNTRGLKSIIPNKEFYKIYDTKQIVDIISTLTVHKEIPLQYGYLNGGAESWDRYANRLVLEESPNILKATIDLLDLQGSYIDHLVGDRKVNVVDLGPGNGLPLRQTLSRLLKQGRLNKYIPIDISKDMLSIVEKNVEKWFKGKVQTESHVRDFTEERFDDLFIADRMTGEPPINLVFLLGGTIANTRLPNHTMTIINNSLAPRDLFFCAGYLDTPQTRRYFDLSGNTNDKKDTQQSGLIPNLLGIESLCDFELVFNEEQRSRFKWLTPRVDLLIKVAFGSKEWNVELNKHDQILLWRHRHYTYAEIIQLLDSNCFDVLQATKSANQNYFLAISSIKSAKLG